MPVFKLLVKMDSSTANKMAVIVMAVLFGFRHMFFKANLRVNISVYALHIFQAEKIQVDFPIKYQ